MREPRWKNLLRKSISACLAAIEIYNKPVMAHREEAFAMLAVNAWELMLKARLVREAKNDIKSIQILVPVTGKDGKPTKRMRVERNRSGNPKTIGLGDAVHRACNLTKKPLDPACAENLWSLVEIRDNAVHFVNEGDPEVARRAYQVGCACLRNYAAVVAEWFDEDLSDHRFMILPLSFEGVGGAALAIASHKSRQMVNLMTYLDRAAEAHPATVGSPYAAAIRVETRIVGTRVKDAMAVRFGGGPGAPEVVLTDEQILERWPLDYGTLQKRAKVRIPGLLFNKKYNDTMTELKKDLKFAFERKLDPRNKKSKTTTKTFYSEAAVEQLASLLSPPKKPAEAA